MAELEAKHTELDDLRIELLAEAHSSGGPEDASAAAAAAAKDAAVADREPGADGDAASFDEEFHARHPVLDADLARSGVTEDANSRTFRRIAVPAVLVGVLTALIIAAREERPRTRELEPSARGVARVLEKAAAGQRDPNALTFSSGGTVAAPFADPRARVYSVDSATPFRSSGSSSSSAARSDEARGPRQATAGQRAPAIDSAATGGTVAPPVDPGAPPPPVPPASVPPLGALPLPTGINPAVLPPPVIPPLRPDTTRRDTLVRRDSIVRVRPDTTAR
jgi:hypothetical protein